jgi:hypothetical protein
LTFAPNFSVFVLAGALSALVPAMALAEPGTRPSLAQHQLKVVEKTKGFSIETSEGFGLSAIDAAWVFGDLKTYQLAQKQRRRVRNVGGLMVGVAPVLILGGVVQIAQADFVGQAYLERAGYATVALGTLAGAGGMGMLLDPRPNRVSTYYEQGDARAFVDEHNRRVERASTSSTWKWNRPYLLGAVRMDGFELRVGASW